MGLDETDLDAQIAYLWKEIEHGSAFNGYKNSVKTMEELKAIDDIELATEQFCWTFERPADKYANIEARVRYAQNWYATYAGTYTKSSSSTTTTDPNSANTTTDPNNTNNTANQKKEDDKADIIAVAKEIHDKYRYCVYSLKGTQIPFRENEPSYDCSSFLSYVLYECGFQDEMKGHQHTASSLNVWCGQKGWEKITNYDDLEPGDILFYANGTNGGIGHVDLFVEKTGTPGIARVYSGGSTRTIQTEDTMNQRLAGLSWSHAYRPEGVSASGSGSGKYLFGEGNIYTMYPTKTRSEKMRTYDRYIGTRKSKDGQEYPKGYDYDDILLAYEYIEEAYYPDSEKMDKVEGELVDPDTMTGVSSHGYIHPLPAAYATHTQGMYYTSGGYHGAYDFGMAGVNGQPVLCVKDGTVIKSEAAKNAAGQYISYGEHIMIDHHDGTFTLYAHMQPNSRMVQVGDEVKQGQQIGVVGTTGNSTGPHLHFEVRSGSSAYSARVDPGPYLTN